MWVPIIVTHHSYNLIYLPSQAEALQIKTIYCFKLTGVLYYHCTSLMIWGSNVKYIHLLLIFQFPQVIRRPLLNTSISHFYVQVFYLFINFGQSEKQKWIYDASLNKQCLKNVLNVLMFWSRLHLHAVIARLFCQHRITSIKTTQHISSFHQSENRLK